MDMKRDPLDRTDYPKLKERLQRHIGRLKKQNERSAKSVTGIRKELGPGSIIEKLVEEMMVTNDGYIKRLEDECEKCDKMPPLN